MKTISWFKEISKDNISIVGGKGANLGEMYNLGMSVPPGFIINADADLMLKIMKNCKIRQTKCRS